MKRHYGFRVLFAALLVFSVVSVAWGEEKKQELIRVAGAGIASDQVLAWANLFMKSKPEARIVVTGSSAGKGFEAFFGKNCDMVLSSRAISSEERKKAAAQGIDLGDRLVGYSGIAVITSPKHSLSELTLEQLRKIFTGECANWKDVGGPDMPIRCLTRRVPESGAALFFQEKVMGKKPYSPNCTIAESWSTIVKVCSTATDLPIGIAPLGSALAAGDKIKVLGIKADQQSAGITPTEESLRTKAYPIILPFWLYWNAKTGTDVQKEFIDFCASKGLPSS